MTAPVQHQSVLLREALELLTPRPGQTIVDATVGLGGHAEALLERVAPRGQVIGIDRDPRALELATRRLARFGGSFRPVRGDHNELRALLATQGISLADGILFDLGVSSMQLDDPERGFSFRSDGPLDMRMDPDGPVRAADLLATLTEQELSRLIWRYGEERYARAIARAVVRERARQRLTRTSELAQLVERVVGRAAGGQRIHPATRTFQALRIAVNSEVDALEQSIEQAAMLLRPGGRLVVISFHSLEDRAAKRALRALARRCTCPPDLPLCGCGRPDFVRILTPRPLRVSAAELQVNPRARSARLRAAERL